MHFDQMNEEPVADVVSACTKHAASSCSWPPVITFSHFLPLQVCSRLQLIHVGIQSVLVTAAFNTSFKMSQADCSA